MSVVSFRFAGNEYSFKILESDNNVGHPQLAAVALCVANRVTDFRALVKSDSSIDLSLPVEITCVEENEEYGVEFSWVGLAAITGATETGSAMLDLGAPADDLVDFVFRLTALEESEKDLDRIKKIVRQCSAGFAKIDIQAIFGAEFGDLTEHLIDTFLDLGLVSNSFSASLQTPDHVRLFGYWLQQLNATPLPDSSKKKLLEELPSFVLQGLSSFLLEWPSGQNWIESNRLVDEETPDVRFSDVALVGLLVQKRRNVFEEVLQTCLAHSVPVNWHALYYNTHLADFDCFQVVVSKGPMFFRQAVKARSAELCCKDGANKPKVYSSRMEKFLEFQLPRLPEEFQRYFLNFWRGYIISEKIDVSEEQEEEELMEDVDLGLRLVQSKYELICTDQPSETAPLSERFKSAAERVQQLRSLSNESKLALYGLYKQATEGDCPSASGGMGGFFGSVFDVVGAAKRKAWQSVKGISTDNAMEQYIELVQHLVEIS